MDSKHDIQVRSSAVGCVTSYHNASASKRVALITILTHMYFALVGHIGILCLRKRKFFRHASSEYALMLNVDVTIVKECHWIKSMSVFARFCCLNILVWCDSRPNFHAYRNRFCNRVTRAKACFLLKSSFCISVRMLVLMHSIILLSTTLLYAL